MRTSSHTLGRDATSRARAWATGLVSRAIRPWGDWEAWSAAETRARVGSLSASHSICQLRKHRISLAYTNHGAYNARPAVTRFPLSPRRLSLSIEYTLRGDEAYGRGAVFIHLTK